MAIILNRNLQAYAEQLYQIVRNVEQWGGYISYEAFCSRMRQREGFVVLDGDRVIGAVTFSDFIPGADITIHCDIDPSYQRRWVTRNICREVFSWVYNDLGLPRCSTFTFPGKTDIAERFVIALGFKMEGLKQKAALLSDGLSDVKLLGMLKEDCKWIQ